MRRYELTFGPREFARFRSWPAAWDDMRQRLTALAQQDGAEPLRFLSLPHKTEPFTRAVLIAKVAA